MDSPEMGHRSSILALTLVGTLCIGGTLQAQSSQNASTDKERQILEVQRQIESRNWTEANRLLAEAATRFPSDPGFENLHGVIAAQRGDFATAEKDFTDAVKRAHDQKESQIR